MAMPATWPSMYSSRDPAGGAVSTASASGGSPRTRAPPSATSPTSSCSRRSGWSIASRCTIIPPIESPMTWARSTSTRIEHGDGVERHVGQRVRLRPSSFDDRPTSRLSNRTTRKPSADEALAPRHRDS